MTKTIVAMFAVLGMATATHADDFSSSQDHLRSGSGNGMRGAEDSNPNDLTNSQNELRRNGRSNRSGTQPSCEGAEYGSDLYYECHRGLSGR